MLPCEIVDSALHLGFETGVYETDTFQVVVDKTSEGQLLLNSKPVRWLGPFTFESPAASKLIGDGHFHVNEHDGILTFEQASKEMILKRSFPLIPNLRAVNEITLVISMLNEIFQNLEKNSSLVRLTGALKTMSDEGKFFFFRGEVTDMIINALISNVDYSDSIRRVRMDRVSEVFQRVYIDTLPKLHWTALQRYRTSTVEFSSPTEARASFGAQLHVNGEQVMEAWEYRWMRELVRFGLSKTLSRSDGKIKVLEIGWGQGISGRAFLAHPDVEYTVLELHPQMAADARRVFAELNVNGNVLSGAWEEILPTLSDHSFDAIMDDIWDTTEDKESFLQAYRDSWLRPAMTTWDPLNLALYRLVKPGGARFFYTPGTYTQLRNGSIHDFEVFWYTNMYSEITLREIGGLHPYQSTTYVNANAFHSAMIPVAIK